MKLLLALISLFSIQSFAAICSCDAPPSCGPRPGSCFQYVAKNFLGKVFVEKGNSNPQILSFSEMYNYPSTINVGWGRRTDGMPFGVYYVAFTSENTFSLFFTSFGSQRSSFVEEFTFITHNYSNHIESLRTRNGLIFLPEN